MDTNHLRMQQLYNNLSAIHAEVTAQKSKESNKHIRVLVIDSDRDFLFRVRNFLMHNDIEVLTVVDGLSGITLFNNHTFDAIVTGPSITRLGGDIFAQYVKSAVLPLPIVGVVNSRKDDGYHFDAVIKKPLQLDALLKSILHLTDKKTKHSQYKETFNIF